MVNITPQECTTHAAPVTQPTVTPMKAPLRLACGPSYHGSFAAFLPPPEEAAAAAGAVAPSPTTPKTLSLGRY